MSRPTTPRPAALLLASGLAVVAVCALPVLAGTALAATGTAVSLQAPVAVTYSQAAVLSGRLVRSGSGLGLSGRRVLLQSRPHGGTVWSQLTVATTASNGTFRTAAHPSRITDYRASYAGTATLSRSASNARVVGVRSLVRGSVDTTEATPGDLIEVHVTVAPAQPGQRVVVQRLDAAGWSEAGVGTLDLSSRADVTVSADDVGPLQLRVSRPAGARLLAGLSPSLDVEVSKALPPLDPPSATDLPPEPAGLAEGSTGLPMDPFAAPPVPAL